MKDRTAIGFLTFPFHFRLWHPNYSFQSFKQLHGKGKHQKTQQREMPGHKVLRVVNWEGRISEFYLGFSLLFIPKFWHPQHFYLTFWVVTMPLELLSNLTFYSITRYSIYIQTQSWEDYDTRNFFVHLLSSWGTFIYLFILILQHIPNIATC